MNRVMVACALAFVLFLAFPCTSQAQQAKVTTLSGCLSGEPGSFTLGAVPSGYVYRLQGQTKVLIGHTNQLIRITGSEAAPAGSDRTGTFTVQNVQVLRDNCLTPLPPQSANAVRPATGKAGAESTAVNTSTTQSVGENTPGAQTQTGEAQQAGKHAAVPSGSTNAPAARGPLAPPQWGNAGQSQSEGDTNAAAAERGEEYPNYDLGVNAMPSYDNPNAPVSAPGTRNATGANHNAGAGAGAATGTQVQTKNPLQKTTQPAGNGTRKRATKRSAKRPGEVSTPPPQQQ